MKPNDVRYAKRIKLFPKISVFHFMTVRGFPSVAPPLVEPAFFKCIAKIRAVRVQIHAAASLEHSERFDRCRQFHAVVGCFRSAAVCFFSVSAGDQNAAPAARTRIPGTCAVCIYDYLIHFDLFLLKK
jgi:hypothetical protein